MQKIEQLAQAEKNSWLKQKRVFSFAKLFYYFH